MLINIVTIDVAYTLTVPGHGLGTPHIPINHHSGREVGRLREGGKERLAIIEGLVLPRVSSS